MQSIKAAFFAVETAIIELSNLDAPPADLVEELHRAKEVLYEAAFPEDYDNEI